MGYLDKEKLMFSNSEFQRIQNVNVLIAGAGGLGTHLAQQLYRTGIKKIYIYDNDKIVETNLNRQILYGKNDIGKYKVKCLKKKLDSLKLNTKVVAINEKIKKNSILPEKVNLIYDALDNFESRFILENLALKNNIPLIHAGIYSWFGQITTIMPNKNLSLKEIFEAKNYKEDSIPSLSPAVSAVASIQAVEGLKVYLNKSNTLIKKLLIIDLNDYSFQIINLK